MRDSTPISVISSLIAVGSVCAIVLTLRGGFSPRIDIKPHEALGQQMARQALSLLKPGGEITVVARDTAEFKHPATEAQVAALTKELQRAHVTVAATKLIQTDPLRPLEVPPGDFLELIRKTKPGGVIVSFMGPPWLTRSQRTKLGGNTPAVIALCPGTAPEAGEIAPLFEQGLLKAAFFSRPAPGAAPSKARSSFDQWFVTLTPGATAESGQSDFRLSARLP